VGNHFAMEEGTTDGGAVTLSYLHTDHLGSVTAATDEAGNLVWRNDYTPFGEQATDDNSKYALFTAKQLDNDTGLYYFNARWYDPEMGRFESEDPVRDGANWYGYCHNNPIGFIDHFGLYEAGGYSGFGGQGGGYNSPGGGYTSCNSNGISAGQLGSQMAGAFGLSINDGKVQGLAAHMGNLGEKNGSQTQTMLAPLEGKINQTLAENNHPKQVDFFGWLGRLFGFKQDKTPKVSIAMNIFTPENTEWSLDPDRFALQLKTMESVFSEHGVDVAFQYNYISVEQYTLNGVDLTSIEGINELKGETLVGLDGKHYSLFSEESGPINVLLVNYIARPGQEVLGLANEYSNIIALAYDGCVKDLAHEVGHQFGLSDLGFGGDNLMGWNNFGLNLNYDQIDFMNYCIDDEWGGLK
jgi:RHS repeat-associated protein